MIYLYIKIWAYIFSNLFIQKISIHILAIITNICVNLFEGEVVNKINMIYKFITTLYSIFLCNQKYEYTTIQK